MLFNKNSGEEINILMVLLQDIFAGGTEFNFFYFSLLFMFIGLSERREVRQDRTISLFNITFSLTVKKQEY